MSTIEQINKYSEACATYKEHLERAVEDKVNQITDLVLLEELYRNLIKSSNGEAKLPSDLRWAKSKIATSILNQYHNENTKKMLDQKLNAYPTLKLTLRKHSIIDSFEKLLSNSTSTENHRTEEKLVQKFHVQLKINASILTLRRDTGLMTFAKGLGVLTAGIFGFGVGGYFAYEHFFGMKATHGHQFIKNINKITSLHSNQELRV